MSRWASPLLVVACMAALAGHALGTEERSDAWHRAGALAAWAGSGGLLASLLLMVREPRIAARMGGLDRMLRWHHRAGTVGYALLLFHPLALAFGAAVTSPTSAWRVLAPWTQSRAVLIGSIALAGLMLGLGITFARHVGYRRWRSVHLALGGGAWLGLLHVTAVRPDSRWALAALILATAALLARGWISDRGAGAALYRVDAVSTPASGVIEATLVPQTGRMQVAPGQFVLTRFHDTPQYQACGEFHPFTVSDVRPDGQLRITIKSLGLCSTRAQHLVPGVPVSVQGPFGRELLDDVHGPQLWIAGGIGITPFIGALRRAPCAQPTTLVYRYRHESDAAFLEELHTLDRLDRNFDLDAQVEPDLRAHAADWLTRVPGLAQRTVRICGPAPMVDVLRPLLIQAGVAPTAIHFESFDFR